MQEVVSDEAQVTDSTAAVSESAIQQRLLQIESRMNAKIHALLIEELSSLRANPGSTGAGSADPSDPPSLVQVSQPPPPPPPRTRNHKPAWQQAHEKTSAASAELQTDRETDIELDVTRGMGSGMVGGAAARQLQIAQA